MIISEDLVEDLVEVIIDKCKEYALSKIVRGKPLARVVQSDHNVMISRFKLTWNSETCTD